MNEVNLIFTYLINEVSIMRITGFTASSSVEEHTHFDIPMRA